MNTMTHKGYAARVEYSEDDEYFVGHIAGIRDAVGYMAKALQNCARLLLMPWMII